MKARLDILRLFDFWRGRLSEADFREVQQEFKASAQLKKEFDLDVQLFSSLGSLADQKFSAPDMFAQNVMRSARQRNTEQRQRFSLKRVLGYSAAWSAVAAMSVLVFTFLPEMDSAPLGANVGTGLSTRFSDTRLAPAVNFWLTLLEGSTGALVIAFFGCLSAVLHLLRKKTLCLIALALALLVLAARWTVPLYFPSPDQSALTDTETMNKDHRVDGRF